MLEHKKYPSIPRYSEKVMFKFSKGDPIVIQEKLDGANASLQYEDVEGNVQAFSRNNLVTSEETLRGFYEYAKDLDKNKFKEIFGTNLRVFGEWLVPHTVKYLDAKYREFYVFDVFDTVTETYKTIEDVKDMADNFGFKTVPVLYIGQFTDWSAISEHVGVSRMWDDVVGSDDRGEGIVLRNLSLERDNAGLIKLINPKFHEIAKRNHKQKGTKMVSKEVSEALSLANTIVTENRVEKILHKLMDENIIPLEWSLQHMGIISKNIGKAMYEDCVKEESDIVAKVNEHTQFGKICASISISHAKAVIYRKMNEM